MGIDYQARLVYGWRISYQDALNVYDNISEKNLSHIDVTYFKVTEQWYVKGYSEYFDAEEKYHIYYIVYKEWRDAFQGIDINKLDKPSEKELMELKSFLNKIVGSDARDNNDANSGGDDDAQDNDDDFENYYPEYNISKINSENIRLYPQLYVF
jgi:hypothetical protein